MGFLKNKFCLKSNQCYPTKEKLLATFRTSTGLNLKFDEETNGLSHPSLSSGLSFVFLNHQSVEITTAYPGYLWWHLTFMLIEITIELGGGEGTVATGSSDDSPPFLIRQEDRTQAYKDAWLVEWEALRWANLPFKMAKQVAGHRAL